ncbi:MAG: ThuA domain-containing protein [Chitinophagaceae bacterium]
MINKLAVIILIITMLMACTSAKHATGNNNGVTDWKKIHVLVYTKNGKGYVHDNIASAVASVQQLGVQHGFSVDVSDNPSDFNDANLKKYNALVFNNTNNGVFDTDAQKLALMHYIQAGGGFVGLHSATGTERNWAWFKRLIGASFQRHAKHQPFKEIIIDNTNPSTSFLPRTWDQNDECYFFKEVNPDLHVLMAHDLSTLLDDKDKPDFYGASSPSVWCHEFDGGREWYTSLGHDSATYFKPDFQKHILGGIEWVIGQNKGLDYSKAHAKTPDDPLPY